MSLLLLKRISTTELPWFGGRRRVQPVRGPRMDGDAVEKWLHPDHAPLRVRARWYDGRRIREDLRQLERHGQSWWLVGSPLTGPRLARAEVDDVAVVSLERVSDVAGRQQGLVVVDVLPADRTFEEADEALDGRRATWLEGRQADRMLGLVRQHLPAFGGGRAWEVEGLSDREWSAVKTWLTRHVRVPVLRELLEGQANDVVRSTLDLLGADEGPPTRAHLAEEVIRRFGVELLAEGDRRDRLAEERFREERRRPPEVRSWTRGGPSARRYVTQLGLPHAMAGHPVPPESDFEDFCAFPPYGPLHDYQRQIAAGIREALHASDWRRRRAVVWLPTGTGKTRVCVETLLLETFLAPPKNCILWIADREELCEQAIATFRHVWMVRGHETPSARGRHAAALRVVRLWGGRRWQDPPPYPTIVVASIQTLARRIEKPEFEEALAELGARCAAVVFDEAHHVVAPTYGQVIAALGLGRKKNVLGHTRHTGPTLVGLTATPARVRRDETERLARRFRGQLLEPDDPYRGLGGFIRRGYVARPRLEVVETGYVLAELKGEGEQWRRTGSLPRTTLVRAGRDPERTAAIVSDLEPRLEDLDSVLVFACSVEHAETLAEVLSRRGHRAMALHGGSPRAVRQGAVRRFRERSLQVLVTCELLATGFDAPNVDAVVLARPVESRVLFFQMIGRGLRGPKNGGTPHCLILDYEDSIGGYRNLDDLRLAFRQDFVAGVGDEEP